MNKNMINFILQHMDNVSRIYNQLWYMAENSKHCTAMCMYQVQIGIQVFIKAHRYRNRCTSESILVLITTDIGK